MSKREPTTDLERQVEAGFDYRGDVTVTLTSGERVDGYLFNRELDAHPKLGAPFVELFLTAGGQARYPLSEIEAVELTGKDHAEV